ncbi:MAG: hypothetical protein HKM95_15190 [Inquilinus sp.]|nr:hypothetical protein [Inquilinus sp.]
MASIDQGGAGVRSGRAGDAGRIVKLPQRSIGAAALAQAIENAVLIISMTPTGS